MNLKYFTLDEFKCPCCGENKIDPKYVELLDKARGFSGVSYVVNSGYRCPKHNKAVGGSSTSSHLKGLAADISATDSATRFNIIKGMLRAGFARIGVRGDFIHVDNDKSKAADVCWLY